jgi:hypothetical protein
MSLYERALNPSRVALRLPRKRRRFPASASAQTDHASAALAAIEAPSGIDTLVTWSAASGTLTSLPGTETNVPGQGPGFEEIVGPACWMWVRTSGLTTPCTLNASWPVCPG